MGTRRSAATSSEKGTNSSRRARTAMAAPTRRAYRTEVFISSGRHHVITSRRFELELAHPVDGLFLDLAAEAEHVGQQADEHDLKAHDDENGGENQRLD